MKKVAGALPGKVGKLILAVSEGTAVPSTKRVKIEPRNMMNCRAEK